MFADNLSRLIREWTDAADDRLCVFHISGNRIVSNTGTAGTTIAVRYRAADNNQLVVIVREDFPHDYFDIIDCQVAVVNSITANKIFRYFDAEFNSLRGRSSSEDGRNIKTAIKTMEAIGLPMSERLERAKRCPEGYEDGGMPLLAFCDFQIARRYRYAILKSSDLTFPSRMMGSFIDNGKYVIFEKEDDAIQTKMQSNESIIIDLWGDPPEAPPSANNIG